MVRAPAAAAVLHGAPRLLVEDNPEEEDKRTLEGWTEEKRSQEKEAQGRAGSGGGGGGAELTCRQLKPANR